MGVEIRPPSRAEIAALVREAFVDDAEAKRRLRPMIDGERGRRVVVVREVHAQLLAYLTGESSGPQLLGRPARSSPETAGRAAIVARHAPDPDLIMGWSRMPRCVRCTGGGASLDWPCPDYQDAITRGVARALAAAARRG